MTCNVERFLAGALDAVLAQDFADYEVVICDNASTDSTWEICERYAAKDSRFRLYRNETNIGLAGNFARVVSLARGEYFRLVAHDDLMAATLLSRCVKALDNDQAAVMAYPGTIIIDDNGDERGPDDEERAILARRPTARILALLGSWSLCNQLFGLMRTDVLRETQLFSADLPSSDRRLLTELVVRGSFILVDEHLFYRRVGESSSYGGDRGVPTYEWLEPNAARHGRFPKKFANLWGDANRLTVRTVSALLGSDLPAPMRLATAMTFAAALSARRAKVKVGWWRRQITHGR
jgi:glycosyltransferase involved in cell wall biosynthesis